MGTVVERRTAQSPAAVELEPERIIATIEQLEHRIEERFPGSGLGRVAAHLLHIARETVARIEWVSQPHIPLRIGVTLLIALILVLLLSAFAAAPWGTLSAGTSFSDVGEFVQTIEAALNELFLIGAAIFFLMTVESRIKRRRALRFIRELRALAHLVDMHQLTKDPERAYYGGTPTASSPRHKLTPFELSRYLDYCSEMLSLTSKVAALYLQRLDDAVVLEAVDEIELLATGLSGKIWQKIMIIDRQ